MHAYTCMYVYIHIYIYIYIYMMPASPRLSAEPRPAQPSPRPCPAGVLPRQPIRLPRLPRAASSQGQPVHARRGEYSALGEWSQIVVPSM